MVDLDIVSMFYKEGYITLSEKDALQKEVITAKPRRMTYNVKYDDRELRLIDFAYGPLLFS